MKYISLLILAGLMVWSWSLATAQPSFTLEQHKRVEEGVENDVHEFIVRKYPQTTDIYCQQFYTETVRAGEEMNVNFRCRTHGGAANDEKVEQTFEGTLRIASKDGFQTWDELGGEIRSPEVYFQNGSRISAKETLPPLAPGESSDGDIDANIKQSPPHAEHAD